MTENQRAKRTGTETPRPFFSSLLKSYWPVLLPVLLPLLLDPALLPEVPKPPLLEPVPLLEPRILVPAPAPPLCELSTSYNAIKT